MNYLILLIYLLSNFSGGEEIKSIIDSETDWEKNIIGFNGLVGTRSCGNFESIEDELYQATNNSIKNFELYKHQEITKQSAKITAIDIEDLNYQFLKQHFYSGEAFYFTHPYILGQNYYINVTVNIIENDSQAEEQFYHEISIHRDIYDTLSITNHIQYQKKENVHKIYKTNENEHNMLNVISFNIWNYSPRWSTRKNLISNFLNDKNPDIIGLQEVRYDILEGKKSNSDSFQVATLSSLLKNYQNYVYNSAMTYVDNQHFPQHVDEGLAIFSKYPILQKSFLHFSRNFTDKDDAQHQRGCLRALIQTKKSKINFFTTHFSLSSTSRNRNSVELLNWMDSFDPKIPQILVGDLNSNPDDNAIQFLLGNFELSGFFGDFKDAWIETQEFPNDLSKGWTYITTDKEPKKRIDFILFRGNINSISTSIFEVKDSKKKIFGSDHRVLKSKFNFL